MDDAARDSAASELSTVPGAVATPLPVECVACYVWRMLDEFGCNATLRWTRRWRDARARRATALEHRLARRGGCCDCELFLNIWVPSSPLTTEPSGTRFPPPKGPCRGVRRGSSQPCHLWVDGRV